MRRFRPYLALFLLTAAVFSWWLVQQQNDHTTPQAIDRKGPREVDYAISGLEVTRMTTAGSPAHRLKAVRMRHFTDDDTTELEKPELTVFQGESPPWEIVADKAWMSGDGELVLLTGEVVIDRAADAKKPPVHLLTSNLRVQPREDYAETDEKVRVETDSDWLDAVGMQAWLRPPSRLKFLSEVKGYYVPR